MRRHEIVCSSGRRAFICGNEVKTVLAPHIQKNGYMSLEELRELMIAEITLIYENENRKK